MGNRNKIIYIILGLVFMLSVAFYAEYKLAQPPDYNCIKNDYTNGLFKIKLLTISGKKLNKEFTEVSDISDSVLIDSFKYLILQSNHIENYKICRPIDWEVYDSKVIWYNDTIQSNDFGRMNINLESIFIFHDQCDDSVILCEGIAHYYKAPNLYSFLKRIFKKGRIRQIPN